MQPQLIVSGGSITHGGWHTWKDFVAERYDTPLINLAEKGQGNEVIATKALLEAQKYNDPIVMIMFTSVDKWDWYVQDPLQLNKLQKEKHPPLPIHDQDRGGFWCTGSWFPADKEYYWKHYYSLDYQIIKTCMLIHHLRSYFTANKIRHLIMFDSPIFEYTEQELNQNPKLKTKTLVNDTTKPFVELISEYDRGLIGFCEKNNLPWFHPIYKWHPGSLAHYKYSCDFIFPKLDNWFKVHTRDQLDLAKKMDKLWKNDLA